MTRSIVLVVTSQCLKHIGRPRFSCYCSDLINIQQWVGPGSGVGSKTRNPGRV